jgi:hypothetical protein
MVGDQNDFTLDFKDGKIRVQRNSIGACTIAKDFRDVLEPTKEFQYEDLAALELAV